MIPSLLVCSRGRSDTARQESRRCIGAESISHTPRAIYIGNTCLLGNNDRSISQDKTLEEERGFILKASLLSLTLSVPTYSQSVQVFINHGLLRIPRNDTAQGTWLRTPHPDSCG